MRIIDAEWEKRNLGVTCYECVVEKPDKLEEVSETIPRLNERDYIVVRIPSVRTDVMPHFQKSGYSFMEAAILLENRLSERTFPKKMGKILEKITWEQMNSEDLKLLYNEIRKGIFKTDRIVLDPFFSKDQAAHRYECWTKDLVKGGDIPYKVAYQGKVVGFFLNKEVKQGVFDGLLAGTYSEYEGSGMGVCIQFAGLEYAREKNGKKYIGHVSANNPAVF
ncbi:MAG: hypothetical protein IJ733_06940 [Lachnospiraceae bacterium]|nr:hypothetical protein [Lachnospiraceae bacterium]